MTDEHKEAMIDKIAQATAAQFWKEQESGRYPNLGLMIRDALIGYESRITEENTNMAQKPVGIVTVGPHDHGPFTFRETAYGADHLPTGDTPVYAAASAKAGYVSVPVEPTPELVSVCLQRFRAEIDKHMAPGHPSGSPGHDSMRIALRAALAAAASEQRGG